MLSCGSHSTVASAAMCSARSERRERAGAAVPLGGARRGDQRLRAGRSGDVHLQRVAAGDAARRMQQQRVAHRVAFGVERLLHTQRAAVLAPRQHGATARGAVTECNVCLPAGGGVHRRRVSCLCRHGAMVIRAGCGTDTVLVDTKSGAAQHDVQRDFQHSRRELT
jgi:hypothetical protein